MGRKCVPGGKSTNHWRTRIDRVREVGPSERTATEVDEMHRPVGKMQAGSPKKILRNISTYVSQNDS